MVHVCTENYSFIKQILCQCWRVTAYVVRGAMYAELQMCHMTPVPFMSKRMSWQSNCAYQHHHVFLPKLQALQIGAFSLEDRV